MKVGDCIVLDDTSTDERGTLRMLAEARYLTLVRDRDGRFGVPRAELAHLDRAEHPAATMRSTWHYLTRCDAVGSIASPRTEDRPVRVAHGRSGTDTWRRAVRAPQITAWLVRCAQDSELRGLRIPFHVQVDEVLTALGAEPLRMVRPRDEGRQRSWWCTGLPTWLDAEVDAAIEGRG